MRRILFEERFSEHRDGDGALYLTWIKKQWTWYTRISDTSITIVLQCNMSG